MIKFIFSNSLQNDAIRNITGSFVGGSTNSGDWNNVFLRSASGAFSLNSYNGNLHLGNTSSRGSYLGASFNASSVVSTDNENRPYNFNMRMFIKV